jgi:hypothetical protein
MRRLIVAASLAALALSTGPGSALADDPPPTNPTTPIEDPIPGQIRQGPLRTQLQVKAFGSGFTAPLYGTFAPGPGPAPGRTTTQRNILYVVDEDGPLWAVDTRATRSCPGSARTPAATSGRSRTKPGSRSRRPGS